MSKSRSNRETVILGFQAQQEHSPAGPVKLEGHVNEQKQNCLCHCFLSCVLTLSNVTSNFDVILFPNAIGFDERFRRLSRLKKRRSENERSSRIQPRDSDGCGPIQFQSSAQIEL